MGIKWIVLLWLVLIIATTVALAIFERSSLLRELDAESATLLRLASQRADQNDAHLTALSAVAAAAGADRSELFLEVAATVRQFYPRIVAIDLLPLQDAPALFGTGDAITDEMAQALRNAAQTSTGALQLVTRPSQPGFYYLVKRSPNTDAAIYALALKIDATALITSDSSFWSRPEVARSLYTPAGELLAGSEAARSPQFTKVLGSASQPLVLQSSLTSGVAVLLPLGRMVPVLALVSALYVLGLLALRQIDLTRRAEQRATLSAQEARLAHASRVNALGEMASGIAHELTQPLTAILAQAQASQHLLKRSDTAALGPVLSDTVTQARRAGAILDRLRRWTRPAQSQVSDCAVNEVLRGVEALLALEAARQNTELRLKLAPEPLLVSADQVELEQVVFNLVRNALVALSDASVRQIMLSTRAEGYVVIIEVSDTGPGIPDELRPRIFEPFVSGRADGTGLGLALCHRLVERMGGEIVLRPDAPDATGAQFEVRLPLATAIGAAG